MATFEEQVEGLTGFSISGSSDPTQNELTQFLKDGVIEVQNRCLAAQPAEVMNFLRVSAEQTSNNSLLSNSSLFFS